jgi:hypothetical protein
VALHPAGVAEDVADGATADDPGLPGAPLGEQHGTGVIAGLARRGLVEIEVRERPRRPLAGRPVGLRGGRPTGADLTPPQAEAVATARAAIAAGDSTPLLLDGVTGGGKTAIYVEAIVASLERGRPALVLVPEIALAMPLAGHAEELVSADPSTSPTSPEVALTRPRLEASRAVDSYRAFSRAAGLGHRDSLGTTLGSSLRWATADTVKPMEGTAESVLSWDTGADKSYVIPALDIFGFEFLLNEYDRNFIDAEAYDSSLSTIRHNLSSKWVVDTDPFAVNQFLHPVQGSMYHEFARSAGLSYWKSLGYTLGGSVLWEEAGENTTPSINDQIASGIGGTFLGEPLFRAASLLLEGGDGKPGFWRKLGAAAISPPTGFNRLVYGDRFDAVFPSHAPAVFARLQLGGSRTAHVTEEGDSHNVDRLEATADVSIAYGLPGKPGYGYERPFDYFHFEFTASSNNMFENIMARGLLLGKDYAAGSAYRGIWGLYGSYDYISPQIFRVSTNAVSIGTTAQWWLSQGVALQGTALGGIGYGAAGTIRGSGERDYHYGITLQELLAFRLILGGRVTLDMTGRHYYVSGVASTESRGSEYSLRGDAALTVRVHGHHACTLKYVTSHRSAHYPDLLDRYQTVGTASLAYTYVGDTRFGAVEWRAATADGS